MRVVGVDEVGRGCWAGPLVAGAVILGEHVNGLKDSKKLSKAQREKLAATIQQEAIAYGLGWVWPADIDAHGLSAAVKTAMTCAVEECLSSLSESEVEIIVDGNINYLQHMSGSSSLVKADDLVPAVSAASIIAKVARDDYMAQQALLFPQYGFEKHVGYGTAAHILALSKYGACELHRMSYKPLQKISGTLLSNG